ncbi:MAG: 4-hydroxy-tetrahydrodipicolinate synthase [Planctomycetota bacterium]|jgi:4-hydroxy-tetrahydrodipicolinate synthase
MTSLQGAYTALVTPFSADGESVDHERLVENIRDQAVGGVAGVVPCGTTGEAPTLSDQEHRSVVEKTGEAARGHGLQVIAGAGSNCTAHAVELHRFAHAAGADAALHVSPYYNKPTQEGLYRHFCTIADSCGLPIVLYNIPGRTNVTLTADTIERLAAHANIHAIKEATGSLDLASEILLRTDLVVLSGDDTLTDRVAGLCEAFLGGEWSAARDLHRELFGISRGLLSLATNPIPIKTAMALVGRDSGALRLPLCAADDKTRRAIAALLAAGGLRAEAVPA